MVALRRRFCDNRFGGGSCCGGRFRGGFWGGFRHGGNLRIFARIHSLGSAKTRLSSPRKRGPSIPECPVVRATLTASTLEYWVARSSRAMTGLYVTPSFALPFRPPSLPPANCFTCVGGSGPSLSLKEREVEA